MPGGQVEPVPVLPGQVHTHGGMDLPQAILRAPHALWEALDAGKIRQTRYDSYIRLWEQANRIKDWERKEKE